MVSPLVEVVITGNSESYTASVASAANATEEAVGRLDTASEGLNASFDSSSGAADTLSGSVREAGAAAGETADMFKTSSEEIAGSFDDLATLEAELGEGSRKMGIAYDGSTSLMLADNDKLIESTQKLIDGIVDVDGNIKEMGGTVSESSDVAVSALGKIGDVLESLGGKFGIVGEAAEKMGKTINASAAEADASLKTTGGEAEGLGAKMATVGKGSAAAFLVVGVAAVDLAQKYQTLTTNIAAWGGISDAQATKITNAFLTTAGTTIYSAEDIAKAYGSVVGQLTATQGHALSSGQAMQVMKASMDLAEGSGESLGSSTKALSQIMQAYQMKTQDASKASDELFSTAKGAGISLSQVSKSVVQVHTQLGALTPPLGQTGALLVDMTEHGMNGSRALRVLGTAMNALLKPGENIINDQKNIKTTFDNLPPSLQALGKQYEANSSNAAYYTAQTAKLGPATAKLWSDFTAAASAAHGASLKLQESGDAALFVNGKFIGLGKAIGVLHDQTAGKTEADKLAILSQDGLGSSAAKLLPIINAGSDSFDRASAEVNKHAAAQEASAKQAQTLQHQLELMKVTLEDLVTKIGVYLIPILRSVMDVFVHATDFVLQHKAVLYALAVLIGGFLTATIAAFAINTMTSMVNSIITAGAQVVTFTANLLGMGTEAADAGGDTDAAAATMQEAAATMSTAAEQMSTAVEGISTSLESITGAAAGADGSLAGLDLSLDGTATQLGLFDLSVTGTDTSLGGLDGALGTADASLVAFDGSLDAADVQLGLFDASIGTTEGMLAGLDTEEVVAGLGEIGDIAGGGALAGTDLLAGGLGGADLAAGGLALTTGTTLALVAIPAALAAFAIFEGVTDHLTDSFDHAAKSAEHMADTSIPDLTKKLETLKGVQDKVTKATKENTDADSSKNLYLSNASGQDMPTGSGQSQQALTNTQKGLAAATAAANAKLQEWNTNAQTLSTVTGLSANAVKTLAGSLHIDLGTALKPSTMQTFIDTVGNMGGATKVMATQVSTYLAAVAHSIELAKDKAVINMPGISKAAQTMVATTQPSLVTLVASMNKAGDQTGASWVSAFLAHLTPAQMASKNMHNALLSPLLPLEHELRQAGDKAGAAAIAGFIGHSAQAKTAADGMKAGFENSFTGLPYILAQQGDKAGAAVVNNFLKHNKDATSASLEVSGSISSSLAPLVGDLAGVGDQSGAKLIAGIMAHDAEASSEAKFFHDNIKHPLDPLVNELGATGDTAATALVTNFAKHAGDSINASTITHDAITGKLQPLVTDLKTIGDNSSAALVQSFINQAAAAGTAGNKVGAAAGAGVAAGVTSQQGSVSAAMAQIVASGLSAAKAAANIHSPSKRAADEIGSPIAQGMAQGILSGGAAVAMAAKSVANAAFTGVSSTNGGFGTGVANAIGASAASKSGSGPMTINLVINGEKFAAAILTDFQTANLRNQKTGGQLTVNLAA